MTHDLLDGDFLPGFLVPHPGGVQCGTGGGAFALHRHGFSIKNIRNGLTPGIGLGESPCETDLLHLHGHSPEAVPEVEDVALQHDLGALGVVRVHRVEVSLVQEQHPARGRRPRRRRPPARRAVRPRGRCRSREPLLEPGEVACSNELPNLVYFIGDFGPFRHLGVFVGLFDDPIVPAPGVAGGQLEGVHHPLDPFHGGLPIVAVVCAAHGHTDLAVLAVDLPGPFDGLEGGDVAERGAQGPPGEAEDRAVEEDVLPARELGVERRRQRAPLACPIALA